jgi:hypothetical protein
MWWTAGVTRYKMEYVVIRARICKRLRSPEIDSKESIPLAYVAWRAGTVTLFVVPVHRRAESIPRNLFLDSLKFTNSGID